MERINEEVHEMQEHAGEAHHDPRQARVTLTMAFLAVFVGVISLLGHRAHTEEIILQNRASDQWAYYQAKSIRRHTYELFLDLIAISNVKDVQKAEEASKRYIRDVERYKGEQNDIETEAHNLEKEVVRERRRGDRFDLGEMSLEAALVISSITLLTRRQLFWGFGLILGTLGLVIASTALAVH